MTMQISPPELIQQLQQDIAACEQLLSLLEQEREALGARDMEKLDTIIEQKAVQLSALEASAQARTLWAREHLQLNPADENAMRTAWQEMLDSANIPQLSKAWSRLKELQLACKDANEVNGKILSRNQKTFGRLLDIVRGQTATPNLYSAAGKSTSNHISHKVGEA
ncbi:flagella synthesis protein FlgN [Teredinibacter haidensis]|uniref:flagella synthesis protein FlgN n=1 Tax=Teredinibacter haidensis TaxID=2731755 RepID=UPI0009F90CC5|nr:flagellar protein FlgN [Teredinibacter haidensis]